MKKNIINSFIFITPLALVLTLPLFVFFVSREYLYVSDVINLQKIKVNVIFSFSYNGESDIPYKQGLVLESKPKIMVVGTSRTMQIRKEFFINQNDFVNAGVPRGQLGNFGNLRYFTDNLPENGSGTLLFIGLDHNLFTERHATEDNYNEKSVIRRLLTFPGINIRRIYLDYLSKKFSLGELNEKSKTRDGVGFSAIYNDSGYRFDGSYRDGFSMKKTDRIGYLSGDFKNKLSEIKRLDSAFVDNGDNIKKNFSELEKFLSSCKERNIKVVGFVPADPTLIHSEMMLSNSLYKKNYQEITQGLFLEFSKHDFIFFDLSDISKFGGKDSEFMDAVHGTDLLYARMFVYMYGNNDYLKKVINKPFLEKAIRDSKNDFLTF